MPSEGRLIVVSNRLPLTVRRAGDAWRTERSSGGLASALDPVLKRTGGLWVGWPGEAPAVRDERREEQVRALRQKHGYVAVDLPADVARNFYDGYANQTLWPLFRILPRREELLRGLLGADLLAFQTHADLQHFRASLLRICGIESRMDRVRATAITRGWKPCPSASRPTSSFATSRRTRPRSRP